MINKKTSMIDLNEKYISFIKETVYHYLQNCEIYLFGSRTKGTAKNTLILI